MRGPARESRGDGSARRKQRRQPTLRYQRHAPAMGKQSDSQRAAVRDHFFGWSIWLAGFRALPETVRVKDSGFRVKRVMGRGLRV